MSNTKPEINIDFAINERGQLVQYFVNPFNMCRGYIISGVDLACIPWAARRKAIGYKFTFLENTFRS